MYIGAFKITSINTILNILFYFFIFLKFENKLTFFGLIIAGLIFITYYIFNVFSLEKGKYTIEDFLNSCIINFILIGVVFLLKVTSSPILLFVLIFLFQNILKILLYYFFVKSRNVLIIGQNSEVKELERILKEKDLYNVVCTIPKEEIDKIKKILKTNIIKKIIITEQLLDGELIKIILFEKLSGVQIYSYLDFYEKLEEKVPIKSISEKWILFGSGYEILHKNFNIRIKRVFDIFLAIVIGLITLPIMIVSAFVVKIESKGPIFFKQDRIGLGNEAFIVYKFRSMRLHDENEHSKYAQDNDNRITKFGNFMRKTRIDELPQLWNVLRGDMSFVGPRCEWDKLCEEYEKEIPFYNIRHSVKPGLTGWAQVKYPYGMGVEDALEKLTYDIYYIKHQNLIFDLIVIFRTVKIVIFGRGR